MKNLNMKKLLSTILVVINFCCLFASDLMSFATPESQGVSSSAIAEWVKAEGELDSVHSFVLVRHGHIIAQGAWAPYDLDRPHQLYSHSKSFTSTAIGFLIDDGKLDLDTPLVKILPEKFPANPDARLLALRIRDLLTMNTGFNGSDNPRHNPNHKDWVKSFFETPLGVNPGTRFRYDTIATHVLAAVVEKISGKPMMEFLNERLCHPLNFGKIYSHNSPAGIACGGYGMYARTGDLAKFGQLYLNEGKWGDKQIISRDWVRLASAKQTASNLGNKNNPPSDWELGYGFQFWRCRNNAFRADGAYGQYTVVMPDQDAVLSVTSCLPSMGRILDILWEKLLPAMKECPLEENPVANRELEKQLKNLKLPVIASTKKGEVELPTKKIQFAKNSRGYETIRFEKMGEVLFCYIAITGLGEQKFVIGNNEWQKDQIWVCKRNQKFEGMGELLGEQDIATSGAWVSPTEFSFRVLFLEQAHRIEFKVSFASGEWKFNGNHVGLGGCEIHSL